MSTSFRIIQPGDDYETIIITHNVTHVTKATDEIHTCIHFTNGTELFAIETLHTIQARIDKPS